MRHRRHEPPLIGTGGKSGQVRPYVRPVARQVPLAIMGVRLRARHQSAGRARGTTLRSVLPGLPDHSLFHHAVQHVLPDQPGLRPLPTRVRPSRRCVCCGSTSLRMVDLAARHHRPGDARHFVGQRHRRQPCRTAFQDPSGPRPGRAVPSCSPADHRRGSQHQQPAYLPVARLGDPAKPSFPARRMLPRHQAEPGGEMPRALEHADVGDRGRDQGCGDRADAGDRRQAACGVVVSGMGHDLRLERLSVRPRTFPPIW